jgi:hypothetical protein
MWPQRPVERSFFDPDFQGALICIFQWLITMGALFRRPRFTAAILKGPLLAGAWAPGGGCLLLWAERRLSHATMDKEHLLVCLSDLPCNDQFAPPVVALEKRDVLGHTKYKNGSPRLSKQPVV